VNCFEYSAAEGIWTFADLGLDLAINFGGLYLAGFDNDHNYDDNTDNDDDGER